MCPFKRQLSLFLSFSLVSGHHINSTFFSLFLSPFFGLFFSSHCTITNFVILHQPNQHLPSRLHAKSLCLCPPASAVTFALNSHQLASRSTNSHFSSDSTTPHIIRWVRLSVWRLATEYLTSNTCSHTLDVMCALPSHSTWWLKWHLTLNRPKENHRNLLSIRIRLNSPFQLTSRKSDQLKYFIWSLWSIARGRRRRYCSSKWLREFILLMKWREGDTFPRRSWLIISPASSCSSASWSLAYLRMELMQLALGCKLWISWERLFIASSVSLMRVHEALAIASELAIANALALAIFHTGPPSSPSFASRQLFWVSLARKTWSVRVNTAWTTTERCEVLIQTAYYEQMKEKRRMRRRRSKRRRKGRRRMEGADEASRHHLTFRWTDERVKSLTLLAETTQPMKPWFVSQLTPVMLLVLLFGCW